MVIWISLVGHSEHIRGKCIHAANAMTQWLKPRRALKPTNKVRRNAKSLPKNLLATFELSSYIATIAACVVSALALVFSAYQFYETQKLQRATLDYERQAKAAEFYQQFITLRNEPMIRGTTVEKDAERFRRAQKSLALLNAIYLTMADDAKWRQLVFQGLQDNWPISWAIREGKVTCLALTEDFLKLVKQQSTHENFCREG